jgi:ABC-type microcin C transport system permease subunit YejB
MLETEIKKLTAVIEALTAQLAGQTVTQPIVDVKPTGETVENIEDTIPDENPEPGAVEVEEYTVAACKAAARQKTLDGVDKSQIKELITALGFDKLSDMDDEGRKKFIVALEKM